MFHYKLYASLLRSSSLQKQKIIKIGNPKIISKFNAFWLSAFHYRKNSNYRPNLRKSYTIPSEANLQILSIFIKNLHRVTFDFVPLKYQKKTRIYIVSKYLSVKQMIVLLIHSLNLIIITVNYYCNLKKYQYLMVPLPPCTSYGRPFRPTAYIQNTLYITRQVT